MQQQHQQRQQQQRRRRQQQQELERQPQHSTGPQPQQQGVAELLMGPPHQPQQRQQQSAAPRPEWSAPAFHQQPAPPEEPDSTDLDRELLEMLLQPTHIAASVPPPPAEAEAEPGSEDLVCVTCWELAPETTLAPCGHRCLCIRCTERLLLPRSRGRAAMCPVCRQEVRSRWGRPPAVEGCGAQQAPPYRLRHMTCCLPGWPALQVESFITKEYKMGVEN